MFSSRHYHVHDQWSLTRLSAVSVHFISSCHNVQTPAQLSSSGSMLLDGRRSGDALDPNAKDALASTAGSNPCGLWSVVCSQLTTQNEYYGQAKERVGILSSRHQYGETVDVP